MLNKCKCGAVAKYVEIGSCYGAYCVNGDCCSGLYESTYEMAELKWNEQNPAPAISPDEFEKRLIESIVWMDHRSIHDPNQFLDEFEINFGFDLREVAREKWAKEHRYDD